MAAPRPRAPVPEPLARRLRRLLRVPARDERVPVVQPLRPALAAALGRLGELPLPLPPGPAGLDGGEEHALADLRARPAAGAVRVRPRGDAHPRADGRRRLPHGLLPAGARAARRGDARLRLHPQPGDRAGERDPVAPRHPGAALVPGPALVEAVARRARPLGRRDGHDHLPRGRARRADAALRVGRARRRRAAGPACAT